MFEKNWVVLIHVSIEILVMKKCLIVDDSMENRHLVRTFLLMEGKFLVKEAASGSEALELLMQESFDVIISDFEMNGGNGFWLLKKVKELQLDTHFIIFSGQIFLSRDIVLAAGADAFFSKPFSLRLMMEHLRELTL